MPFLVSVVMLSLFVPVAGSARRIAPWGLNRGSVGFDGAGRVDDLAACVPGAKALAQREEGEEHRRADAEPHPSLADAPKGCERSDGTEYGESNEELGLLLVGFDSIVKATTKALDELGVGFARRGGHERAHDEDRLQTDHEAPAGPRDPALHQGDAKPEDDPRHHEGEAEGEVNDRGV